MREPFTKLFVHLVWATWDRLPILSPEVIAVVEKAIQHECHGLGVEVVAFGAVSDHVHILVRIPTTLAVADLVKQVKGSSSHLLNHRLKTPFKWQGGYGAFTVSASALPRVRDYVLNQETHHQYGTVVPTAELQPDERPTSATRPRRAPHRRGCTTAGSPRRRTSCGCCSEFIRPAPPVEPRPLPPPAMRPVIAALGRPRAAW